MIGSKFSRHFFNQSEVNPKPIVAFSRALCWLRAITLSFDTHVGLPDCLHLFSLAKVITLVLVLRHSIETRSSIIIVIIIIIIVLDMNNIMQMCKVWVHTQHTLYHNKFTQYSLIGLKVMQTYGSLGLVFFNCNVLLCWALLIFLNFKPEFLLNGKRPL